MANITISVSSDYKRIYVKSDSSDTNTDYPVLEVYLDSTLTHTMVVGGSATIGSVTYETTSGADDLNYASTTTTNGTEYIQEINVDTLNGSSTLTALSDGVWEFKLLDAAASANIFIGIIVSDNLDCCISSKLDKICSSKTTGCSLDEIIKLTNNIRGLLYSGNISARLGEFKNAECKYKLAKTLCEGDCGCGC